jgi:hypothetical protein
VVGAIERLHAGRLEEHIDTLARHAWRAELWGQGFDYLARAGLKASNRLALHEAAVYLEQALDAANRLPRRRDVLERFRSASDARRARGGAGPGDRR